MARLIDADVIKAKLMEYIGLTNGFDRAFNETPTIEAVSVVRCRECKHWNVVSNGCMRNPSVEGWQADDFCSYGERESE